MIFERTSAGLSNVAQFYGVEKVLFVEGKVHGDSAPGSLDIVFWSGVFQSLAPHLKIRVMCRGGKPELLSIARQVAGGAVDNVLIAMDRDYDFEIGSPLAHPAVFYTHGYSWENDVWISDRVEVLVGEYSLVRPVPESAIENIRRSFAEFIRKAGRVATSNVAARRCCAKSVLRTEDYRGLVKFGRSGPPCFNSEFFLQELGKFNRSKSTRVLMGDISLTPQRHVLGHLLAFFCYHLVCRTLKGLGQSMAVSFDYMNCTAINNFVSGIGSSSCSSAKYYRASLGSI